MNNTVVTINSRLPMPAGLNDIDSGKWRVLCESVFPGAKSVESIVMALDYCRARKLDPFKRPVNIVTMWNKTLKKEVETIWPSINEVQVTASRTGQYAGMDEPKWGKDITRTFKGFIKGYNEEGVWEEGAKEVTIVYPEYCAVTVYRMINGIRCPFTEPAYWLENYSRSGKSEVPNATWQKRTRGQLLKVAKAFSLRAAFPEEGEYTAEEMEGKEIDTGGIVIDNEPQKSVKSYFKNASLRNSFLSTVIKDFESAATLEELEEWQLTHSTIIEQMKQSGNEHDALGIQELRNRFSMIKKGFTAKDDMTASFGQGFSDIPVDDIPAEEKPVVPHFLRKKPQEDTTI